MEKSSRIVVIEDETSMLRIIRRSLEKEGHAVDTFQEATPALRHLEEKGADLVVCDLMLPDRDGFFVLEETLARDPQATVILITAFSSVEAAVKAMKRGAHDFIPKPFDPEHLVLVANRALESRRLRQENIGLRRELERRDGIGGMIGNSRAMQAVKDFIHKVKDSDGTVLVSGESGVGKELVARALHDVSRRRDRAFVPISCGALPDELLESELFGYERGAFSGAVCRKKGLVELADGGTLFLDEVGTVSPLMQVKLLRFLQERSFFRLGGKEEIRVDLRILAATNTDLEEAVRREHFRQDLFYRLNVLPLRVPPLRERREDIGLLSRFFIERFALGSNRNVRGIAATALAYLESLAWPGNVRELQNMLERAVTLSDGQILEREDFGVAVHGAAAAHGAPRAAALGTLQQVEESHILAVLRQTGGNRSEAARILGIDYSTLLRRLKNLQTD